MAGHPRDTRGIVDAPDLFTRVRFRLREPAPGLRPYVEHYWLIDWDLSEPYTSHVVPHPSVHLVFQRNESEDPAERAGSAEVYGVVSGLFSRRLEGRGRVCGVKFRPGGFRPFAPDRPVSALTGRRVPAREVLPAPDPAAAPSPDPAAAPSPDPAAAPSPDPAAVPSPDPAAVLGPAEEDARIAALDAYLLALDPRPDHRAARAMALVDLVRTDRSLRRVDRIARAEGLSVRSLQRLFATYVGVGPKWVVLRYRIHEALQRAGTDPETDWAGLAADLGYSDQAHLVRDFTATVGVPPAALAQR